MVFALAGDSTTTTFMRTFKKGRAKEGFSGAKQDCRDDARCARRVPALGARWRQPRLTSGTGAPVRQPRPGWLRAFRRADRGPRRLKSRAALQPGGWRLTRVAA